MHRASFFLLSAFAATVSAQSVRGPELEHAVPVRLPPGHPPAEPIVVTLTVTENGSVEDPVADPSGDGAMADRAVAAARQWRFVAASENGVPRSARIRVEVPVEIEMPMPNAAPDPEAIADAVRAAIADVGERVPREEPAGDEDSGFGASAEVELEALRAQERTASDIDVERDIVQAAPRADGADVLRSAPGLYLARPAGDAVGHRISLRGFDAEHGQDIEIRVGGIPINLPSHVHGQGYVDLGFLIAEVVDELRVTEGVYDPQQGDFAVAGSVDVNLGVAEQDQGIRLKAGYGSFDTFRALGLWSPSPESFAAVQVRRTDGFGQNRNGMNGSAMLQYGLGEPGEHGWRHRITGIAHGARYRTAGVLRRDDVASGRVGFYDVYPEATAQAQSAFDARVMLGFEAEHRAADGANSTVGVWAGYDDFRLQQNFTGFTERSRQNPDWTGRGDLIEQLNRTTSIGLRARHRTKEHRAASWLSGTLEIGIAARFDSIDQAQNLLQAPQNETWDLRVDAEVRAGDLGAWLDLDLALTDYVALRGGARVDLLYYDIDDRLGNFIPDFREETFIIGYRRSAFGAAAGPRVALEVRPAEPLTVSLAYGEGYRSPQARTLEDGESAPFTKVRSADLGTRLRIGDVLDLRIAGYWTKLSDDVAFEPREGRLERIGPTRRLGGVAYAVLRPIDGVVGALSVTYVDAELLEAPPASAEDPEPAFQNGQNLPYVPPWVVRLDAGVDRPLTRVGNQDLGLRAGLGYSFLSPRPLPFDERAESVHLVDASLGLSWGRVRASVDVFNLFDDRYSAIEFSFPSYWNRDAVRSRLPHRHTAAGAPRTVMASVEVLL